MQVRAFTRICIVYHHSETVKKGMVAMTMLQRLGLLLIAFGLAKLIVWAVMNWRARK